MYAQYAVNIIKGAVSALIAITIKIGTMENNNTVIQGWVCRDKKDNALYLHVEKPYRAQSGCDVWDDPDWWESDCPYLLPLDKSLFPHLTWESDPIEVEIIIKRKKK